MIAVTLCTACAVAFSTPTVAVGNPLAASPSSMRLIHPLTRGRAPCSPIMAAPPPPTDNKATGFFGRVVPTRGEASAPAPASKEEEKGELSIKELLSQYGVIALLFHFTVWITCLASVFALLSFGLDVDSLLPDWLTSGGAEEGASAAAGAAGRAAATLAVVEAIGPARLALTVAATPKVSERARQFKVVRDVEEAAMGAWERVAGS